MPRYSSHELGLKTTKLLIKRPTSQLYFKVKALFNSMATRFTRPMLKCEKRNPRGLLMLHSFFFFLMNANVLFYSLMGKENESI